MNQVKWLRLSLLLLLALGLAMPAFAQVRPLELSDSQEPGSVIVFPKFIAGTVLVDGVVPQPATEIEIGVVCPKGFACPEHSFIKIHFHWVCPGSQEFAGKYICPEVDFDLTATYFSKLRIGSNGAVNIAGVTGVFQNQSVPLPPCARGYLIGWVVDALDRPIKFDGLIGDAVLREPAALVPPPLFPQGALSFAASAYNAIPIQADPALATGALITLSPEGGLIFDGAPGHYTAVTGKIYGDVRFANLGPLPAPPLIPISPLSQTFLTLLTLDVRSNRPNLPTFVDLKFYNENERLLSAFTEFICWTEVPLTSFTTVGGAVFPVGINDGLTQLLMNTQKGLVVSGPASKERPFGLEDDEEAQAAQASDSTGPVTLLGIIDTVEFLPILGLPDGVQRSYSYSLFNDSVPVPTTFYP
jgi:hypothetical protein